MRVTVQERHARLPTPDRAQGTPLRTPEEEAERRARVYALVKVLQASFKAHPEAGVDLEEFLYDEDGLPK